METSSAINTPAGAGMMDWASARSLADAERSPQEVRDWLLFGLPFAGAAAVVLAVLPPGHALRILPAAIAVILFVVTSRVKPRLPFGWVGCQQASFVLMLFSVPLNAVPVLVWGCVAFDALTRRIRWRVAIPRCACDSWFTLAPVLILALAAPGPVRSSLWPAYVAAFGAQFVLDAIIQPLRDRVYGERVQIDNLLGPLAVDTMLTPVGMMAALTVDSTPLGTLAMLAGVTGVLALFNHERRQRIDQTTRALHDPLTGVANRALFSEFLSFTEQRCRRRGGTAALLLLDLDGFKQINDTHGHARGDEVLCLVAELLQGCIRRSDVCARLGGDEFAAILTEPTGIDDAEAVAAKVRQAFDTSVHLAGGERLPLRASIGVATFGGTAAAADALSAADARLYADKRAQKRI